MPVLRSQTVYLSITVTLASCPLLCHSNTCSKIRSCSLMCLALSQHHAALALSCALLCLSIMHATLALSCAMLCLSITLLLLSHAPCPCFVSASRCSCSLMMCLALFQHHATLALSCALFCLSITPLMCLALSQHATRRSSVLCLVQATRSCRSLKHVKQSCIVNGCEILDLSNELSAGHLRNDVRQHR